MTLTKDNLARRNWNGDTRCSLCHSPESIQHLFFDCLYAEFLWRAVHLMFGISPPQSIDDLFNRWSKMGGNKHNSLLLTAASALCWAVWITRNEVVFLFCRFFSGEPTGSANRQDCSGVMIIRISCCLQANIWRHQLCTSLLPRGGCQIGLLVSLSQKKLYFVLRSLYGSYASLWAKLCNNWSDSTSW